MSPASCRGEIVHVRVVLYFLLFYIKRSRVDPGIPRRRLSRGGTAARSPPLRSPWERERGLSRGRERKKERAPAPPEERQRGGMAKEMSSNLFRAFFDLVRGRMSCACNRRCEEKKRENFQFVPCGVKGLRTRRGRE